MKLRENKKSVFKKRPERFRLPSISERKVIILLAFAVVGGVIVLATRASVISNSFETEDGVRTGNVSNESDAGASGGSFVRFGQHPYQDMFVSSSGSDTKDGRSEANAVKTVAKAVQLANDYTRIRIMAGTYTEQVLIQKSNLILEPYGNGDVTIIGAIPEFITGVNWTYVQSGIYKKSLGRDEFKSDGSNVIYGSDGQQQWTYPDLSQLLNKSTVGQQPGVFINNFLLANEVYVVTGTNQPPTAPLYIGAADPTLYIKDASNISINSVSNSKLKLSYGSYNVYVKNGNNIKVSDVDITGGKSAVAAYDTSNITIKNNNLHGAFGRDWDWADVKERPGTKTMENQAVHIKPLTKDVAGIIVEGNEINGYFNGVNLGGTTSYFIDNSTISNNRIHDNIDDGIEMDSQYRNLVIKGNTVFDAYSPLSATAGAEGPVYVFENVLAANRVVSDDFGSTTNGPSFSIKMNNDNTGLVDKNIHFYHNTFYFAGNSNDLRKTIQTTTSSITQRVSFINNIFYSYDGGLVRGAGRAQDQIEWDGNVFYAEKSGTQNFYAWNSIYDTDHSYASLNAIVSGGAMPAQWQGNAEGNPNFNCTDPANASCFRANGSVTKPAILQPVPGSFAESNRLNDRSRIGAFE